MGTNGHGRRRFGDFEFDFEAGRLFRDGEAVRIQPQPLRVLEVLVARPGEIVSREELRNRVWGEATFVEFDQGLNYCIRQIRLALSDAASQPLFIETLPKQGYRFIAGVAVVQNGGATNGSGTDPIAEQERGPKTFITELAPDPPIPPLEPSSGGRLPWVVGVCALLAIAGAAMYSFWRGHPATVTYTQLTDFTDSA